MLSISKLKTDAFIGQDLWIDKTDGSRKRLKKAKTINLSSLPQKWRLFRHKLAEGAGSSGNTTSFEFNNKIFSPKLGKHWSTTNIGLERLAKANRLIIIGKSLRFVNYFDDYPITPITTTWTDTVVSGFSDPQKYVVQTAPKVIQRCILMTTDPGDLVFDPTCGSGTTAYVAEKWGRRWITCDTSRVALTLAKQRLMTASFDYYKLRYPEEGLKRGCPVNQPT